MPGPADELIFREIVASLDHGLLVFDNGARLISASQRALDLLGLPSEAAAVGTSYPEIERAVKAVSGWACALPPLKSDDALTPRPAAPWTAHQGPDGRVILCSRMPLPEIGFAVVVVDGTAEKERHIEQRLQAAVAQRIASAKTFDAALEAILQTICRHAGWRYGETWLPDGKERSLHIGPTWAARDPTLAALRDEARQMTFRPGEGLVGRVCATRRPEIIPDIGIVSDRVYNRAQQAVEAGFRAVAAIPLVARNDLFAVCLFNIDVLAPRTERVIRLVEALAPQLYSLLRVKAASEEAIADRRLLTELLTTVGEAIITIDAEQRIIAFNREATRLFGYRLDEVLGRPLDILLPREAGAAHRAQVRAFAKAPAERRLMGGRPEIRGRRKNGSEFVAEASISKLELNGGMAFTAVLRDVTELRNAEASLKESEQRFRDIAEVAGDWIWETDANHRVVFAGGRTRQAGGFGERLVAVKTRWEIAGADPERDEQWAHHRADLEAHRPFRDFRYSAVGTDGKLHHLSTSGMPIFDDKGTFKGYRGTASDITLELEMKREVESKSALLKTTFETIGEGVVVIDAELRIAAFNRTLLDLLSIAPDALRVGDPAEKFVQLCISASAHPEDELERLVARELSELRRFQPHLLERSFRHGKVLEIRGSPLPGGGIVRTYTDVTLRKRTEEELRLAASHADRASRAKSEFLANMSHELRTPLNAIIGFSELMQAEAFGPLGNDRYQNYAEDIHQSGAHLLAIINDILDLSKAEAGQVGLVEETVDILPLINGCVTAVKPQARDGRIAIAIETSQAPPKLRVDETRLKQVLINLLSNAVKFTPSGGSVVIDAGMETDGWFVIRVRDTGIGMASEDIAIALEPFGQIDSTLSRKYQGTGLGLPLAKRLVELHGGEMTIESMPGHGTTVSARLPPQRVAVTHLSTTPVGANGN